MENYEKLRVVGRGASGTVYLCRRRNDGRLVIIKQIPVEQMTKDERQTALNEARVLSMLDHPNIIEYNENFLEDKALMIVMEYAEGGTLFDYLQERGNALLDEGEVLFLFTQILVSLQHVHSKQILHRDLKTQNILMNKGRDVVKTGDFGISKILSSKSKAVTVVGTPCYISPELCEGKPYNQKSDIWALGCILYELLTLKKAFEASTLPALVMKIMRGSVAPVSDRYSIHLRKLLMSMLRLDPSKRPTTNQVMAEPIVVRSLARVIFEMGKVKPLNRIPPSPHSLEGSRHSSKTEGMRGLPPNVVLDSSQRSCGKPHPSSAVYTWGSGMTSPAPLTLPSHEVEIVDVSIGRAQRAGITSNGRLILWETSDVKTDSVLPGAVGQPPLFVPRFLEGQSAVTIKTVACGDMFTACLTDRGILMTYGSGTHGCLGHGSYHDVPQARIVEPLLGYEICNLSCGASHVVAVSNNGDVFSWGRGDNGRLGLGSTRSFPSPQPVPISGDHKFMGVSCSLDASVLLTESISPLICGSNRFNKLGLDQREKEIQESLTFLPVCSYPLNDLPIRDVSLGTSHAAYLTVSGDCWMLGSNHCGQIGSSDGIISPRQPQKVSLPGDVKLVQVSCGDMFTVSASEDGRLFSWGKPSRGRLGRQAEEGHSPGQVVIPGCNSFEVTSLSCSHGNTLIAVKIRTGGFVTSLPRKMERQEDPYRKGKAESRIGFYEDLEAKARERLTIDSRGKKWERQPQSPEAPTFEFTEELHEAPRVVADVIELVFESSQPTAATWFRDKEELLTCPKYEMESDEEGRRHQLLIHDVTAVDRAVYSVEATTEEGEILTASQLAPTETKPKIMKALSDVKIEEGKLAEFVCKLTVPDVEEKDIKWFKGDVEIEPSKKFVIEKKGQRLSLTIQDIAVEDASDYTVQVKDTESKAVLEVQEKAPEITKPLEESVAVLDGNMVFLEAQISREDVPVTWMKDGKELNPSTNVTLEEDGTTRRLILTDVTKDDTAQYTLRLGDKETSSSVVVKNVPHAPIAPGKPVASDVDIIKATLTWSLPEFDGGSEIIGYIVEKTEVTRNCWPKVTKKRWSKVTKTLVKETTFTVKDLIEGKEYLFRVIAENAVGQSRPSEPSDVTKAEPPYVGSGPVSDDNEEMAKQSKESGGEEDGDENNSGFGGSGGGSGSSNHTKFTTVVKNFYKEHDDVARRSWEEIDAYYKKKEMEVDRRDIKPITQFHEANFPDYVQREIDRLGFAEPTPIQAQGWPIALSGNDLIGIAQTGPGKTLAYILPGLVHLGHQAPLDDGDGPICLVLCPTRESAEKVQEVSFTFGRSSRVWSTCVYGKPTVAQLQDLQRGVQIVIATPEGLSGLLKNRQTNLKRCSYLVLDEADRMLDMRFESQIREILAHHARPDRQTLMLSTTWPMEVQSLASDFQKDPIRINIGALSVNYNNHPEIAPTGEETAPTRRTPSKKKIAASSVLNLSALTSSLGLLYVLFNQEPMNGIAIGFGILSVILRLIVDILPVIEHIIAERKGKIPETQENEPPKDSKVSKVDIPEDPRSKLEQPEDSKESKIDIPEDPESKPEQPDRSAEGDGWQIAVLSCTTLLQVANAVVVVFTGMAISAQ